MDSQEATTTQTETTPPPAAEGDGTASPGFEFKMPSMPAIPEIPDWVLPAIINALSYAPYIVLLYFLYQLGKQIFAFVMTQRFTGQPKEWVVIMRDGEQVKAGVGLAGFKTPFDSVAKFPSRLVKVEVTT